jgi:mevalonate kinase
MQEVMNSMTEHFFSKILLFGEYGVICGSRALSIPFSHFSGGLSFLHSDNYTNVDFAQASNANLEDFCHFLSNGEERAFFLNELMIEQLEKDVQAGLFFESSIPQGYGVGSSGALVAAIYSRYGLLQPPRDQSITSDQVFRVKEIFSKMESFFHGKSSGLDPLISYLKSPLHLMGSDEISLVGIPRHKFDEEGAIFLLDTGIQGKTQTFVGQFLQSCESEEYRNQVKDRYIPLVHQGIDALLEGNSLGLFSVLSELSAFQLDWFKAMIPEKALTAWRYGVKTGDYFLKLCGSGGGGFILGFTHHFETTRALLRDQGYDLVPVYRNGI